MNMRYFKDFEGAEIDKIRSSSAMTDGMSVNFHETILTILVDKSKNFIIGIETERTAATNKD
jgi:hypothetical protein